MEVLDCVYLISEGLDFKVDVAKDVSIPFFQRGFGFFYFLGKAKSWSTNELFGPGKFDNDKAGGITGPH